MPGPTPPPEGGSHEGLREPLARDLERLLRRAVWEHATAERRRHHLPVVRVGLPGGRQLLYPERPEEPTDQALRTDIIAAMRRGSGLARPLVWLTRSGDLDLQDIDVRWLGAARQAYAEAGLPVVFVVANRHGWRDPRSGVGRTWQRLRVRTD